MKIFCRHKINLAEICHEYYLSILFYLNRAEKMAMTKDYQRSTLKIPSVELELSIFCQS
jgi:hypothetical protein